MNATDATPNFIKDYYIVCSLSGFFAVTAISVSCLILAVTWRSKRNLHTVRHLLMCNTSVASILYCIVQVVNYIFLIFLPDQTSDVGCRWRGYFSYVTICGVAYSFAIQAVSRLFITVFSNKHRQLTTFKVHYLLMAIQWSLSIMVPLPSIITKDITFRPRALCWVPLKYLIHVCYTYAMYYIVPTSLICMIYLFIYCRVRSTARGNEALLGTQHTEKRNLELLRNILILVLIYLSGGVPTLLFLITANRVLYLIGIVTISLTVAIEKLCTILLDREFRQTIRVLWARGTRVIPLDQTKTGGQRENLTRLQRPAVQTVSMSKNGTVFIK